MPTYDQSVQRRVPRPLQGSDAGVPLALAGGAVFLVIGAVYGLLTLLFRAGREGHVPRIMAETRWWAAFSLACLLGLICLAWWLWKAFLRTVIAEEQQGAPAQTTAAPVRLETEVRDGNGIIYATAKQLEISDQRLLRFADLSARCEGDLSEGRWGTDKETFPEGINQFRAFRTRLVNLRLVSRTSTAKNSPFVWTRPGWAFVERLASYSRALTHEGGWEVQPPPSASGGGGLLADGEQE
jgi:hypothetical protein